MNYCSQTFTCYKCTRTGTIFADTPEGVFRIAHAIGWREATVDPHSPAQEARVICSRCPGGNAKKNLSIQQAEAIERALQQAMRDPALLQKAVESGALDKNPGAEKPQDALPAIV